MDPSHFEGSQKLIIGVISVIVLLLLIYPWILVVVLVSFSVGYVSINYFDRYSEKLNLLIHNVTGLQISTESPSASVSSSGHPPLFNDPLQQHQAERDRISQANSSKCQVCPAKDCKRGGNCGLLITVKNQDKPVSQSPLFTPAPFQLPKVDDVNLKIDARLDASTSKFLETVFDYYISSDWAPYLTRKQLKLVFKQLLTNLGERVNYHLIKNPNFLVELSKLKLIPLILHYIVKIQSHCGGSDGADLIFPSDYQEKTRLRVRKLSRIVLSECCTIEDDRKCKLWMEICVAVLADGVFWNVFILGKDKIPELVGYYAKQHIISRTPASPENLSSGPNLNSDPVPPTQPSNPNDNGFKYREDCGYDETDRSLNSKIPFLLDNFLDRKDSLEQPDPIVSRWRPTLKEIIEETELLYPLIQYLKHVGGQKALAYLQAVLDDAPDAKDFCRRVLEIEYLPGFCRSNYFHESMGLSRVEQGLEVVTDGSPGVARRSKGHSRSASYGSKSNQALSDLLKIDGVVEGLPLYCNNADYASLSASSGYSTGSMTSGLSAPDGVETDSSIFRRKPQLEDIVAKFFKSTHKSAAINASTSDSAIASTPKSQESPKRNLVSRVGIDAKLYSEWSHPDVTKRVTVDGTQNDVLRISSDILTSSISINPWMGPVISSWMTFLDPYLKPHFNSKLEETLNEFLTLDLFISSVDLITDAFNSSSLEEETHHSNSNIPVYNSSYTKASNRIGSAATSDHSTQESHSVADKHISSEKRDGKQVLQTVLKSLCDIFISHVLNIDKFLGSLGTNRDYIFLFFVDVLDLLVAELFSNCDTATDSKNSND